ncbi:hypothetical protein Tco_0626157 [Tanacetum coccineum]|uniref:Uncharacterized protein n=1 Tax=Tanacetum coccineum TaxID=301880 RepID=A0ABQ4WIS9_9ASTR
MHNNIMAVGSRDRPPMLATGRYAQWRSRFLRYIDTRPNGDALRKCILEGPYTPTTVVVPAVLEQKRSFDIETIQRKEIDKPNHRGYTTIYSAFEKDSDPKQAQRVRPAENLALIAKYKNDNQTGQFRNQRTVNVVGARETVGGQVVQLFGIQCFNCKEFEHLTGYNTEEENIDNELEAHTVIYMEKIQEVPNANSGPDFEPLEQVQYDTDDNVFANDIQHFEQSDSIRIDQNDVECDDERVSLANLIANLKLDVDENKKI